VSRHQYQLQPINVVGNRRNPVDLSCGSSQQSITVIPLHERVSDGLEMQRLAGYCAILRCHEKTLFQWVEGSLTPSGSGQKLKFDPVDVAAFVD